MASYYLLSPSLLLPPFLYRVSNILGYLPQDLVGHNSYDYFHPDDMQKMIQLHHEGMLPCRHDNGCHGNLISLSPISNEAEESDANSALSFPVERQEVGVACNEGLQFRESVFPSSGIRCVY